MSTAKNSRVSLQTLSMPSVGIGSWQSEKGEVGQAVDWALEAGVRLVDTAAVYMNEGEIGEVLKKWLDSGENQINPALFSLLFTK